MSVTVSSRAYTLVNFMARSPSSSAEVAAVVADRTNEGADAESRCGRLEARDVVVTDFRWRVT